MRAIFHYRTAYAEITQFTGDKSAAIYCVFNYIEFSSPSKGISRCILHDLLDLPEGTLITDSLLTLFKRVKPHFLDTTPSQT
jgi:hypothetical protein